MYVVYAKKPTLSVFITFKWIPPTFSPCLTPPSLSQSLASCTCRRSSLLYD